MNPSNFNALLRSHKKYDVEGLAVSPDVIGLKHVFRLGEAEVEIQLPSKNAANRKISDPDASVSSWWAADNSPIQYEIHRLNTVVRISKTITLPIDILELNLNSIDLISGDQKEDLEKFCEEHNHLAERAVEYWLSVLRWTTEDPQIARPYFASNSISGGVRLFDENTEKKIWTQSLTVCVPRYHLITIEEWRNAETRLRSQEQPPIYLTLKHEAERFKQIGDYRRSIIDLAISCETFLRNSVLDSLPSNLSAEAWKFIEEGNINQFVSKLIPSILNDDAIVQYNKNLKPEISSLFSKRNDVMHRGNSVGATKENCDRFLKMLKELIAFVPANLK